MDRHPITQEQFAQFGKIIHNWALLELQLLFVIGHLMRAQEDHTLFALYEAGFDQKRNLFEALIDGTYQKPIQKRARGFTERMADLYKVRNWIGHCMWRQPKPDQLIPYVLKTRNKLKVSGLNMPEEPFTMIRLTSTADEIMMLTRGFLLFAARDLGFITEERLQMIEDQLTEGTEA